MKRAILVVGAFYLIGLAITMSRSTDTITATIADAVMFAWLASPILLACLLSRLTVRPDYLIGTLLFELAFTLFMGLAIYWIFFTEHDAQYQLMILPLPAFGIVTLGIFLLTAAVLKRVWKTGFRKSGAQS